MDANNTEVVLGGPGSGKTHTLIGRVEEALSAKVLPSRIGFFSFTKKAAEEAKSRACHKFGLAPDDLPHFRTFHSMAYKYLGTRRDQMMGWSNIKELGKMLGMDFKGRMESADDDVYGMAEADRMLFLEGLARNTKKPLKKVWEDAFEDSLDWRELERFALTLQSYKKSRGLRDFNDLIENFCLLDPRSLPKLDLMIVDEAQDNSPRQWDAMRLVASNAAQVIVAGDDCQEIFSWSGSDSSQFTNMPGRQTTLEQSYRVPSSVHRLANSLTDRIINKRPRTWLPRQEVGTINWYGNIDEIDMSQGTWLLLARNGYMLKEMEEYCLEQGFSFNSVGSDPLKSPSLSAIRTWESLRKGNSEPADSVLDVFKLMARASVPEGLLKVLKSTDPGKLVHMSELRQGGLGTSSPWYECLIRISPRERDYFRAAWKRGEKLLSEPRIKISTIHSAKGGEADNVVLITDMSYRCYENMNKGFEDEVKVWFVGVSRTRKTLNLIMPRTDLFFEL